MTRTFRHLIALKNLLVKKSLQKRRSASDVKPLKYIQEQPFDTLVLDDVHIYKSFQLRPTPLFASKNEVK